MRRFSAHLGYLFTERPARERFAAASRAGFSAVEQTDPYALPASVVDAECRDHGLTFVQMALPNGDAGRGEKGLACLPDRRAEFRELTARGLDYARRAGSRHMHVMSGIAPSGVPFDQAWKTYVENLADVCDSAAAVGMPVLIEPISAASIPGYLMSHPDLALRAIGEVASPNLSLLLDTFHAEEAGVDATHFLRRHSFLVSHLHIADRPGRHEPGTGRFDFAGLFDLLSRIGYTGSIGLEYSPASGTEEGLDWRRAFETGT